MAGKDKNLNYSVSIIIPLYNERELLPKSLSKIHSFCKNTFSDFEIIIVESGSTDGSREEVDYQAKKLFNIRVIHERKKRGYGAALRLGFQNASKDLVWPMTVDLPFSLNHILAAVTYFPKYDCVLSYRIKDSRGLLRKIQSYSYNFLVKLILGLEVRHTNSAFKVFRRDILKKFKLVSSGWFIDAEFAFRLKEQKVPYVEIGVELLDRKVGQSSVKPTATFETLGELWHFVMNK